MIAQYYDHPIQNVLAVFVHTKQYAGVENIAYNQRQSQFFIKFHRFRENYMGLNRTEDANIYFNCTDVYQSGDICICGGGNGQSRAGDKRIKDDFYKMQTDREKNNKYFEKKYRACITGKNDERLFLGITQIWHRVCDPAFQMSEEWVRIAECAYSDPTLAAPFPILLDKKLVPLAIRNKVWQKWEVSQRTPRCNPIVIPKVLPEQEVPETVNEKVSQDKADGPTLVLTEDLRALLEDEDWL